MPGDTLIERELSHSAIGAFYEVYNTLGFGFLESVYANSLERELVARGHRVAREYAVRILYKNDEVGFHRVDMLVDERLVVEIKSSAVLAPVAQRQLLNYLRATNLTVGLLFHFGPEARFYRKISPCSRIDSANPAHSSHPIPR